MVETACIYSGTMRAASEIIEGAFGREGGLAGVAVIRSTLVI